MSTHMSQICIHTDSAETKKYQASNVISPKLIPYTIPTWPRSDLLVWMVYKSSNWVNHFEEMA